MYCIIAQIRNFGVIISIENAELFRAAFGWVAVIPTTEPAKSHCLNAFSNLRKLAGMPLAAPALCRQSSEFHLPTNIRNEKKF